MDKTSCFRHGSCLPWLGSTDTMELSKLRAANLHFRSFVWYHTITTFSNTTTARSIPSPHALSFRCTLPPSTHTREPPLRDKGGLYTTRSKLLFAWTFVETEAWSRRFSKKAEEQCKQPMQALVVLNSTTPSQSLLTRVAFCSCPRL